MKRISAAEVSTHALFPVSIRDRKLSESCFVRVNAMCGGCDHPDARWPDARWPDARWWERSRTCARDRPHRPLQLDRVALLGDGVDHHPPASADGDDPVGAHAAPDADDQRVAAAHIEVADARLTGDLAAADHLAGVPA